MKRTEFIAIGDKTSIDGISGECVESASHDECESCVFNKLCMDFNCPLQCLKEDRKDKKEVVFKKCKSLLRNENE